jgi:hypothetical protein
VKSKGAVDGPEAGTGVNFTRPEFSPCLAGFTNMLDPIYVEALALIKEGRRVLYETTRADMPNFVLRNPVDLAREQGHVRLRAAQEQSKAAIVEGRKAVDAK